MIPILDWCEWCGTALTILGINAEGWIAECEQGHQLIFKDDDIDGR